MCPLTEGVPSVCGPQGCGAELPAEESKLLGSPQLVHVLAEWLQVTVTSYKSYASEAGPLPA
jgi:hypothetical protein